MIKIDDTNLFPKGLFKVNIYWLAKNAGTSVEQLERFYLKNMELSAEQVENLQTLGDEV